MDEHRYAKYGAATGIVFVIFLIVGFVIVCVRRRVTSSAEPASMTLRTQSPRP